MNSTLTSDNLTAVSAQQRESALNQAQTLDMSILLSASNIANMVPRREDNSGEANGLEEPDVIYDNGATVKLPFNFDMLQPHQAAFALAYGLGVCQTVPAASGYLHAMTPIKGGVDVDRDLPTFTFAQRLGNMLQKRLFCSGVINTLNFSFAADDWVKGSGEILATGKTEKVVDQVSVTALDNATTLTLPAAVLDDALDNVQRVRGYYNDAWQPVTVTAVSGDELTITALSGSGDSIEYRVLYAATPEPSWATFPARVTESALRISQMCLTIGGAWNGAGFVGGRQVGGTEFDSCTYTLSNGASLPFTPCAGGSYAGAVERATRSQSIKLNRKIRDMLLQQQLEDNEYFGLHIICEGAEFDIGQNYTVELIFPKLGILTADLSDSNGKIAEAGDLKVLHHETYGSVIARVKNLVATFAAA